MVNPHQQCGFSYYLMKGIVVTIGGSVMKMKELGEFNFIDSITTDTIVDKKTLKMGIGDDSAVYIVDPKMDQLVSTDTMVEGIHFSFDTMRPFDMGFRLTAANFSDIAAMGGVPKQVVVSIAASRECDVKDLQCIYDGIKSQCKNFNVNIIGGDTVETTGPLVLTMTVMGEVPANTAVLRSGAKDGDWVGVTNMLGGSAVGLDVLAADEKAYFTSKDVYQRPVPQVELGSFLRLRGVTSMNDISDGLVRELHEIAKASNVHITITKEAIPLHEETVRWGAEKNIDPVEFALYGGEDFQLVFTCPKAVKVKLEDHPLITFIGQVDVTKEGVTMVDEDGNKQDIMAEGYTHFGS